MIYGTEIVRLDGLFLVASVEDQNLQEVQELKNQVRQVLKKMTPSSEPRASIESKQYNMHYYINDHLAFIAITERTYPKKLAQTYLSDIASEFQTSHSRDQYLDPQLRPYSFSSFDRYIESTKKTYQDSRATDNLSRLNNELKDVTQVMTKNIEDLLYRGDSLDKMGDMSARLKTDSARYRRKAQVINWQKMMENWGIWAALAILITVLIYGRFIHGYIF